MTTIMMVAGEASGDFLGGALLATLRERFPQQLTAIGVGGPQMRANGLQGPFDINDLAVVGLVEVIKCLPRLVRIFRHLTRMLAEERPQLLVTIDLPDFNLLLAGRAKALGIPIIHYVGPQVWAWRRGRVARIAHLLDHLLVLFPFEPAIYAHTTLPVTFVGHPLVQRLPPVQLPDSPSRQAIRHAFGVAPDEKLVVLLPGSRHGELQQLLAPMLATCHTLAGQMSGIRFALALADTINPSAVVAHLPAATQPGTASVALHHGQTYALLAAADAALVASGTATLEAALLGTPMVVVYRVKRLTYAIGRRLIRVPFISLANLVAGYGLVPERIQDEVRPALLAQDLITLLTEPATVERMRAGYADIRHKLSPPPRQAADVVAEFLATTLRSPQEKE